MWLQHETQPDFRQVELPKKAFVRGGQENAAVPDAEVETGEAGERSRVLQNLGFASQKMRIHFRYSSFGFRKGFFGGILQFIFSFGNKKMKSVMQGFASDDVQFKVQGWPWTYYWRILNTTFLR